MLINEITYQEIEQLTDVQLTKLIKRLVYLETIDNRFDDLNKYIPLKITIGDGGCDGMVSWKNGPEKTKYLPFRKTYMQIKAKSFGPKLCYDEVLDNGKLKTKIEEIVNENGCYLVICSHRAADIDANVENIRNAVKSTGNPNWSSFIAKYYDCEIIADWVNEYPQAVFQVYELLGKKIEENFKTFQEFENRNPNYTEYSFVRCDELNKFIQDIIALTKDNVNKYLRIIGLSGLGKTRLLYEAIKEDKEIESKFLYCSANLGREDLPKYVKHLVGFDKDCLLVIDECDLELHRILKKEVDNTKVKLITIYNDPTSVDNQQEDLESGSVPFIRLEPKLYEPIIEGIIVSVFPEFKTRFKNDISRIKEFAMGFPLMAVNLAKDIRDGIAYIGQLTDEILINKMLGLEKSDDEKRNVLRACSIFEYLGFYEELQSQVDFVASNKLISNLDIQDNDIIKTRFCSICNEYIERGIIDRKGRYIFVKPRPLALKLAAEWWKTFRKTEIERLLRDISVNGLDIFLCNQIAKLDFLPEAKELTKNLCGEQGPFGNAEVLNTELGSRLFRSLVEVNPEATTHSLIRIFGSMSKEQLLKIDKGRRNLIWALEKIIWRDRTFLDGMKLLLSFAVAENESWGNNATGEFLQRFHVFLPATEANLDDRFSIIEYAYQTQIDDYRELAIKALDSALLTHYYTRDVGAEYQGVSKSLIDYQPKTISERDRYWEKCLGMLSVISKESNKFSDKANAIVAKSIRGLVSKGLFEVIINVLETIIKSKGNNWPECRSELQITLRYEKGILTIQEKEKIIALINLLTPSNILERYKIYVMNPTLEVDIDDSGNVTEESKTSVIQIAEQFAIEFQQLLNSLETIYIGYQHNGYDFGFRLGEILKNDKREDMLRESLNFFKKHVNEVNFSVFIGFIRGTNNLTFTKKALREFLNNDSLIEQSSYICSTIYLDSKVFDDLLEINLQKLKNVRKFLSFKYSNYLENIEIESLVKGLKIISLYSKEGAWVALSIYYGILFRNKNKFDVYKASIKEILFQKGLIQGDIRIDMMEHTWEQLIEMILNDGSEIEFAIHLTQEIVDFCKSENRRLNFDIYIENLFVILMAKYFEEIWPQLSNGILSDFSTYFSLMHLIGAKIDFNDNLVSSVSKRLDDKNGLLFKGKNELIIEWCKENKPLAPQRIARFLPIFDSKKRDNWHPFTLTFINEFGADEKILDEISANMGSYSWSGSLVPLFKAEKELYIKILDHKYETVVKWAKKNIEYLEEYIKREKIEDEELYM